MKTQLIMAAWMAALIGSPFVSIATVSGQVLSADAVVDSEVEVLPRGPVHEAFAEPVLFDPAPGMVIHKKPPQPVEELPPEEKPEGDDVIWIPGYWAWDDDSDNFIWVSGFWRVLPPGRQWVPGYWAEVSTGFQWVSGFWAAADSREVDYLPSPPPSLEYGPSTAAPSADHFWAPGNWQWYDNRYMWRAGTWTMAYPDWVWVPSYYVWTPRGCIWVNGYWDYQLAGRGLLYAPVRFGPSVFARVGYAFSPSFAVDLTLLTNHFFVRPSCRHYYFGDYHDVRYVNSGVYPWFTFHSHRGFYDPIYVHHRHHHGRDWDNRLRADYRQHRDHAHSRSPHSFDRGGRGSLDPRHLKEHSIVRSTRDITSRPDSHFRWERLPPSRRDEFSKIAHDARQLADHRGQLEREPTRDGLETGKSFPGRGTPRLQLPKSPIVNIEKSRREGLPGSAIDRSFAEKEQSRREEKSKNGARPNSPTVNIEKSKREGLPGSAIDHSLAEKEQSRREENSKNDARPKSPSISHGLSDRLPKESPTPSGPATDTREKKRLPDFGNVPSSRTKVERPDPFKREPSSSTPRATVSPSLERPSLDRSRQELNPSTGARIREDRQRPVIREPSSIPGRIPDVSRSTQPRPERRTGPSLTPLGARPDRSRREAGTPPIATPRTTTPRTISPSEPRPELRPSVPRTAPTVAPTPRIERPDRSNRAPTSSMPAVRSRPTPTVTPSPSSTPRIQPRVVQPRPEPRPAPAPGVRSQPSRPSRPEPRLNPAPSRRTEPSAGPGNRDRNDRKR